MVVVPIKQALHHPEGGIDVASGLELVKDFGQADEAPVPGRTPADQHAPSEAKRLVFIDQDECWLIGLGGRHDQGFRFTSIEIESVTSRLDQAADFGGAWFVDPKPSFRYAQVDLGGESSQFPLPDPRADDHLHVDVPEQVDRIDRAERHKRGRIADKRHLDSAGRTTHAKCVEFVVVIFWFYSAAASNLGFAEEPRIMELK